MNDVNWIDWSLKDGKQHGSPNAPGYGQELSEWTRGLIALRKRWTHFRKADFADYAPNPRSQPGDPANDGRLSYAWEGPAAGAPSQLAAIWWGQPNEPDLMVIYNENWTPFTVTNLGDWSQQPWKVLARSWRPRGRTCARCPIGRRVRTPVSPSRSREDLWRSSPLQGDFRLYLCARLWSFVEAQRTGKFDPERPFEICLQRANRAI